jgi:putative DNA methylase
MVTSVKSPKKLIEVAIPLDAINEEASRRKRKAPYGYPTTLHKWWAQRPVAAARGILFAQLVNDPGFERNLGRGVNKDKAQLERERLFSLIQRLVSWDNTNDQSLLAEIKQEVKKSWLETCHLNRAHPLADKLFNPEKMPPYLDPFGGSGGMPLEAQRIGMETYSSDLNPVAVMINKAMIELPPKFSCKPPIGPIPSSDKQGKLAQDWTGSRGLAEDVRRYGAWMREQAFSRIGHLYPKVTLPPEHGGGEATVIAWIWARTVKSPNPAYSHVEVPLTSGFVLSTKAGKESWLEPVIEGDEYRFEVRSGTPPSWAKNGTKLARGANFECILSKTPIDDKYIKSESMAGRMGMRMLAVVVEGKDRRLYLPVTKADEEIAKQAQPQWQPTQPMNRKTKDLVSGRGYGFFTWADVFSNRQLVALTTLSDLVLEVITKATADAKLAGMIDDDIGLEDSGVNARAYGETIATYLAFAVSRVADYGCTAATWRPKDNAMRSGMPKQALPMTWDFAEGSPFGNSSSGFTDCVHVVSKVIATALGNNAYGKSDQRSALNSVASHAETKVVISTDPPYYDNISYADLSDFFYVWLRKSLGSVFPSIFTTLLVPKDEELIASAHRHESHAAAEKFFLEGMTQAMSCMADQAHPAFPTTIYYAFKQSDTTDAGTGNTGWETFLEAVLKAGFTITGTWPVRTESDNRQIGIEANALASSVVLVCRKRDPNSPTISRREFLRELKEELSEAVEVMIGGGAGYSVIAPVDLAQAVIGPGMAIFSKYASVLEADGSPMSVHAALVLINRMLVEGDDAFDPDTQFCMAWFDQFGWSAGDFGQADVLARAKGTAVSGVQEAGVIEASGGKVKLLKHNEYPNDWSPENDNRIPAWEALHQMIRAHRSGGDAVAGGLLARMHERSEPIRQLAYRLYTLCERKGWAEDARAYNELITAWPHIESASHEVGHVGSQAKLDI